MLNTKQELLERIRLGADSFLELKEVRMSGPRVTAAARDDLADELAALANTRGGVCILGVDDRTRQVLGIPPEHVDQVETFVRDISNDSIKPPLPVLVYRMFLPSPGGNEVPVLKIEVTRSLFVHKSPGGYFHRVGSSKREMSPEYLARLFQQRSQVRLIRFDEQTVPKATLDDLDESLWRRFQPPHWAPDTREVFLDKLGIARQDEDGVFRPTVAGILLACDDPRRFLPNAFIQAVAYRGMNVTPEGDHPYYQIDARDITGPLDQQVGEALRFVARNMRVAATKTIGRTDLPQYDLGAVFEALGNAVAHRDYAIYGSKIRLRMFSDRLELYSLGALANTMTVDSLPLRQSVRNELVTSLLARCKIPENVPGLHTDRTTMMDKRGEGVPIILERSQALSGKRPEYRLIDNEELLLTIHAANPPGEAT